MAISTFETLPRLPAARAPEHRFCSARPSLPCVGHSLPVVQPHVTGDQRPVSHLLPYPDDRVRGPNAHRRRVCREPGTEFLPHDAHPLLIARLRPQANPATTSFTPVHH